MVTVLLTCVIVGVVLWSINAYIPMQPGVKKVMNIAVIVLLILWLLNGTGLLASLPDL